jgi:hypothetical protein
VSGMFDANYSTSAPAFCPVCRVIHESRNLKCPIYIKYMGAAWIAKEMQKEEEKKKLIEKYLPEYANRKDLW